MSMNIEKMHEMYQVRIKNFAGSEAGAQAFGKQFGMNGTQTRAFIRTMEEITDCEEHICALYDQRQAAINAFNDLLNG